MVATVKIIRWQRNDWILVSIWTTFTSSGSFTQFPIRFFFPTISSADKWNAKKWARESERASERKNDAETKKTSNKCYTNSQNIIIMWRSFQRPSSFMCTTSRLTVVIHKRNNINTNNNKQSKWLLLVICVTSATFCIAPEIVSIHIFSFIYFQFDIDKSFSMSNYKHGKKACGAMTQGWTSSTITIIRIFVWFTNKPNRNFSLFVFDTVGFVSFAAVIDKEFFSLTNEPIFFLNSSLFPSFHLMRSYFG